MFYCDPNRDLKMSSTPPVIFYGQVGIQTLVFRGLVHHFIVYITPWIQEMSTRNQKAYIALLWKYRWFT